MKELAYADMNVGDSASLSKTVTESDILSFAGLTMDFNPVHVNAEYAKESIFKERIAHGMLSAGFISAVLGTTLPGPNAIYLGQELKFTAPVKIGDTVTATATIIEKKDEKRILKLKTVVTNQRGEVVVDGNAVIKKIGL
ncbi:MaoC family dehydratase [Desulfitobacterium metallireducens]|uniref:Enoyl-CoA hydratase n=1 Tax=Desulfitobacterium metallireducens DSM 15288 TaxID=871968 RepID=W0EAX0_9FIRM|nr:MaoC family dehydratase [Desulfitobacterium metallireducens]AHF06186.1 enoyl-CoA hydratase [Desulfitobacterium metallireducens DSM 15288]